MMYLTDTHSVIDPITFEVISNRIWQISEEGKEALVGVAASPIAVETRDCYACVYLPDGTPVEGAIFDQCVASVIRLCEDDPGISEGDMFLINDPWIGPKHAPDVTIVAPVHHEGKLVAWVGAMTHHVDLGAVVPGASTPGATDAYHEGLRIPPLKLIDGGVLRSDLFRFIMNMLRSPEKCALDYKAQIAANNVQRAAIKSLFESYGSETALGVMHGMVARAEARMRTRLRELPDGIFYQTVNLDSDGVGERMLVLKLAMTKSDDEIVFDFSGTSPQVLGPINAPTGATNFAVAQSLYGILAAGGDCIDGNAGVMRPITVIAPEGTLVNPRPPAACSAAQDAAIGALVQGCIAQMLSASERYWMDAMAIWPTASGSIKVTLHGTNQYGNLYTYTFMDNIGLGGGASATRDGVDSAGDHSEEPGISNIETHEAANPILFLYRRELCDSGGPGMYRGGVGMEAMFVPYGTERLGLTLLSYGVEVPIALGAQGGLPGGCVAAAVVSDSNIESLLKDGTIPSNAEELVGSRHMFSHTLLGGQLGTRDVFSFRWIGGAGYGDPLDRNPAAVARDIRDGRVSTCMGRAIYGVSVDDRDLVDEKETAEWRARLRGERLQTGPVSHAEWEWDEWNRKRFLGPAGARIGEYLELTIGHGRGTIKCRKCGYELGPADAPLDKLVSTADLPLSALPYLRHPWLDTTDFHYSDISVLRQFLCPVCATRFSMELSSKVPE